MFKHYTFHITSFLCLSIFFAVLIAFPNLSEARETGFDTGNTFQVTRVEGQLMVACHEGMQNDMQSYFCQSETLDPAEYARFVTAGPVQADSVKLTATHADGSQRSKSGRFDGAKGISAKAFNLWISTLLQRPLLKGGKNKIDFELSQSGRVVKAGSFEANVVSGNTRRCPPGNISSMSMMDCRSGGAVCDRYFRQYNYCQ
jgi:hypothetical protein